MKQEKPLVVSKRVFQALLLMPHEQRLKVIADLRQFDKDAIEFLAFVVSVIVACIGVYLVFSRGWW